MLKPMVLLYYALPFVFSNDDILSHEDIIRAAFHRPLLEIVWPFNGAILDSNQMELQLAIDDESYTDGRFQGFKDSSICVGMKLIKGIKLINSEGGMPEKCFEEQSISPNTSFSAANLAPGGSYMIRVLLKDQGNVVAVSIRSFRVGSVALAEKHLTIVDALQVAVGHHRGAELDVAAKIYAEILLENPTQQDALHLMGLVLYQDGKPEEAVPYMEAAIRSNNTSYEYYNSLGLCLQAYGEFHAAIVQFKIATRLQPDYLKALFNIGLSFQELHEWDQAIVSYAAAVTASVGNNDTLSKQNIALDAQTRECSILQGLFRWSDAMECLNTAVERWPQEATLVRRRGTVAQQLGAFNSSLIDYQTAVSLGSYEAEMNIVNLYEIMGYANASLAYNVKTLFMTQDLKRASGHIILMQSTILPRVLPSTSHECKMWIEQYEDKVHDVVGFVELIRDRNDPTMHAFSLGYHLTFYHHLNKQIKIKLARLYSVFCPALLDGRFNGALHITLPNVPNIQPNIQRRRLRIGFACRFFNNHVIGILFKDLLLAFDTTKFEIFVFALVPKEPDSIMMDIEKGVEHFIQLPHQLSVCQQEIASQALDVLVYPEISTEPMAYFLSFARLAPIQAAWWGHPDTTGNPNIDYYLGTQYEHQDADDHYSESLYRMRGMGIHYTMPTMPLTPESEIQEIRLNLRKVHPMPPFYHMYLTLQPLSNYHPDFDNVIERILSIDELAQLFFIINSSQRYFMEQLKDEILTMIDCTDVVLDPFYSSSPISSLQTLSRGKVIVTMPGRLWVSRITLGLYAQMGVFDGVAFSPEEYTMTALRIIFSLDYRRKINSLIRDNAHKLFSRKDAVQQWEQFFTYSVQKKQNDTQSSIA